MKFFFCALVCSCVCLSVCLSGYLICNLQLYAETSCCQCHHRLYFHYCTPRYTVPTVVWFMSSDNMLSFLLLCNKLCRKIAIHTVNMLTINCCIVLPPPTIILLPVYKNINLDSLFSWTACWGRQDNLRGDLRFFIYLFFYSLSKINPESLFKNKKNRIKPQSDSPSLYL